MIQEFHISITPVGQDRYWLRTEVVAAGVPLAEAQADWPVEDWLKQATTLFQDPLQNLFAQPSLGAVDAFAQPSRLGQDPAWIQLGQSLYQYLFQDRIRDSWLAAQGIAQNRRQTLRLRLGFKDSRLQRLPWELLYGDDRPLATGVDVILCRYYQALGVADLAAMADLPEQTAPINILVVISAPDDQERLALRQEVQTLIEDLQPRPGYKPGPGYSHGNGPHPLNLNLTILEQPGRPELAHALEQGQFQVLHYAGHSDVSETGGELYLVNRQTGLTDWLSGEDLAGLLVNNGIRLAVFNSCRGAYTATDDAEAGWREQNLVQALVNRGVPGVIAMAERIPDDVAVTFTRLLYRNLQQGYSIDLCLSRVRQGLISAYRSDQPFWMLPILYLRPDFDGYLYTHSIATVVDLNTTPSEGPLVAPDYSADPDISGLAEEILTGHTTPFLPDLEPAAEQPNPDNGAPPWPEGTPPIPPLPDLLSTLETEHTPDYLAETATVTNLVQRLSNPVSQNPTIAKPVEPPADQNENLLPYWTTPSTDLEDKLPRDPDPVSPPSNHSADRLPVADKFPDHAGYRDTQARTRPRTIPGNLAIWIGLGFCSLATALALAITALSRLGNQPSPAVVVDPPGVQEAIPGNLPARDSAVMTAALGAIAADKPELARKFIEQLLDQGDLEAAFGVISRADPNQLLGPDIAFVRGRLLWQQLATETALGTAQDAQRYWSTAVEADPDFLAAWVALGFANYELGDFTQALKAWENAIALDRQQLRDIDPAGRQQVTSDLTTYAYAGLAMAYQKLSELNPDESQRADYQQLAETYLQQALSIQPLLLNSETLVIEWIWTPSLIESWQTAVERIASRGPGTVTE